MDFVIIDIETTGGNHRSDKITEIAIIKHNGVHEIERFHRLVNPEKTIPSYITSLTGIDDRLVARAPKFFEIAKDIVEFTQDCYFIAHNVNFDYGFIRSEFASLGFDYERKTLCTVRMARKLLPGYKSYSLGKLSNDLGIELVNHHRAMADTEAATRIFELLFAKEGFEFYLTGSQKKNLGQTTFIDEL